MDVGYSWNRGTNIFDILFLHLNQSNTGLFVWISKEWDSGEDFESQKSQTMNAYILQLMEVVRQIHRIFGAMEADELHIYVDFLMNKCWWSCLPQGISKGQ